MNYFKAWILVATLFTGNANTRAQTGVPEIGKPCPDFVLKDMLQYSSRQVSLKDLKGKPVILDFFSKGCSACFASFPKTNQLQKEYEGKIQFILVGKDDAGIRPLYEKFRQRYDLKLPVAYNSDLVKQFGINSFPHVIWIDEAGIVRAITVELTQPNIKAFLDGTINLAAKENKFQLEEYEKSYDSEKPLLINHNGGNDTDFLFRSLLTPWSRQTGFWPVYYVSPALENKLETIGESIVGLYKLAYGDTIWPQPAALAGQVTSYGKYWPVPLLEVKDSTRFRVDFTSGEGVFSYSLIVPPARASAGYLQEVMRRDLQNYFGYEAAVEKRLMPCWRLTANAEARDKLKSKGGAIVAQSSHDGVTLANTPLARLVHSLGLLPVMQDGPPIIDETGITHNIDIKIDAVTTELGDIKKELQRNGLDLVKGEREMKVIVIRDPK